MTETCTMRYDPDDAISLQTRADLLDVLLPMARAHAFFQDEIRRDAEVEHFNVEFNQLSLAAQRDTKKLAVALIELFVAVDRAACRLAAMHGCSPETALRQIVC